MDPDRLKIFSSMIKLIPTAGVAFSLFDDKTPAELFKHFFITSYDCHEEQEDTQDPTNAC